MSSSSAAGAESLPATPAALFQQMLTAGIRAGVLQVLQALAIPRRRRPDRQEVEDLQMVRPEEGEGEGQGEW